MKTKFKYDVAGLGVCSLDYLGIVPQYPKIDTKNEMGEFTKQGGGLVGTALVTLARLGAKVCYLGKLGNDDFSKFLIEDFRKENVETRYVITEPGCSPYFAFCLIEKNSGKRTITWTRKNVSNVNPEEIHYKVIEYSRYLLVDHFDLNASVAAAKYASQHGTKVVSDIEVVTPNIDKLVKLTDILISNEEFALAYTSKRNFLKAAEKLFQSGDHQIVVTTAGIKGCAVVTKEDVFIQQAFKVKVKDTTGAGDAFHGAFIYGLIQGWNLRKVAGFASAVAGLNCAELGGRAGIPDLKRVNRFLKHAKTY